MGGFSLCGAKMKHKKSIDYLELIRQRLLHEAKFPDAEKQTFAEILNMDEKKVYEWWDSLDSNAQYEVIRILDELDAETMYNNSINSPGQFFIDDEHTYAYDLANDVDILAIGDITAENEDVIIENKLNASNLDEANEVISNILNRIKENDKPKKSKRKV